MWEERSPGISGSRPIPVSHLPSWSLLKSEHWVPRLWHILKVLGFSLSLLQRPGEHGVKYPGTRSHLVTSDFICPLVCSVCLLVGETEAHNTAVMSYLALLASVPFLSIPPLAQEPPLAPFGPQG